MKIFNNYLFRVMSTWFAQYVTTKFQEQVIKWQGAYSIINVGTADNVAQINDAFAADSTAASKTVTQQWPGESEPSQHIVYPQIMYIGGL
jgi:hypothetical protein